VTPGSIGSEADTKPDLAGLHADVGRYYAGKLRRFGPSPLGVDWSCQPTQDLRFIQLLKLCGFDNPASLNDFGCGYGALFGFMQRRFPHNHVDYLGIDLSPQMIRAARKLWHPTSARFHNGTESPRLADYTVASGIFNVVSRPREGQVDAPGLYCTEPQRWVEFCADSLGARATIVDDYGMCEFTLIARHPDAAAGRNIAS
jgi:SAM-dependent methyltransferase